MSIKNFEDFNQVNENFENPNFTPIIDSVINGNYSQAKSQFNSLNMRTKKDFINWSFGTNNPHGLDLCRSILIDLI